jgi:UTP-glucose-1-phosphate uridylyltransferase
LRKVAEGRPANEPEKAKISDEEKDQIVVFGILKQFANYKDDPKNALLSSVSYDYIKDLGIIVLSDDQRKRIWEIVEKDLKEEAILKKGVQSVERALQNVTREMIITGSKKRALKEYFDTIIEFERDLLTEINEHKAKKKKA